MKHSLTSAATATGISKSTIYRAIKSGKISALFEDGVYKIDPAELHRVFAPVSVTRVTKEALIQSETHDETPLLRQEIHFLKQQLMREQDFVMSLERRLDEADTERRKLTALLTFQQEEKPAKVKDPVVKKEDNKLWKKIFKILS
jgi:excisionase family DNA binding protein